MSKTDRSVNRTRRRLLKAISVPPLSLAAGGAFPKDEYVVIDGWVMKRGEIEIGEPGAKRRANAR